MKPIRPLTLLVALVPLAGCPIIDDVSPLPTGPGVVGASASPGAAASPAARPSARPTRRPSAEPTEEPGEDPTDAPSDDPADDPSDDPSGDPATDPTAAPAGAVGVVPAGQAEISVVAGAACLGDRYGEPCYVDGPAERARFSYPTGVTAAPDGTIFVAANNMIRVIAPSGAVSTLGGAKGDELFAKPTGLALDAAANLVVRSSGDNAIRLVTAAGKAGILAGGGEEAALIPGEPKQEPFSRFEGIALAGSEFIYTVEREKHRIVRFSRDGRTSVLAGGPDAGFADGDGASARFYEPAGIAVGPDGNLYLADQNNNAVRRITPDGEVTTVAGGSGSDDLYHPRGIAVDGAGNLIVADERTSVTSLMPGRVRRIAPDGTITSIAESGWKDAAGDPYHFEALGVFVDASGSVLVTDVQENRVLRLDVR